MKFSMFFEDVVENVGGVKPSSVSVCFLLEDPQGRVDLHDWSAEVELRRNGHPFRKEGSVRGSAIELIDELVAGVRKELQTKYNGEGCNIDPEPIIAFLEEKKGEFVGSLPIQKLNEKYQKYLKKKR